VRFQIAVTRVKSLVELSLIYAANIPEATVCAYKSANSFGLMSAIKMLSKLLY
jgi:hypothetical protein